jgi:hypothetical protein
MANSAILANANGRLKLPQGNSSCGGGLMEKSVHTKKYRRVLRYLRKARKNLKLTQEQVDEKLGAYKSYTSKIESGQRRMDFVELYEFCRLYGIPPQRIFRLIEKEKPS